MRATLMWARCGRDVGEMWAEMWARDEDVGRCGEMWGDVSQEMMASNDGCRHVHVQWECAVMRQTQCGDVAIRWGAAGCVSSRAPLWKAGSATSASKSAACPVMMPLPRSSVRTCRRRDRAQHGGCGRRGGRGSSSSGPTLPQPISLLHASRPGRLRAAPPSEIAISVNLD